MDGKQSVSYYMAAIALGPANSSELQTQVFSRFSVTRGLSKLPGLFNNLALHRLRWQASTVKALSKQNPVANDTIDLTATTSIAAQNVFVSEG